MRFAFGESSEDEGIIDCDSGQGPAQGHRYEPYFYKLQRGTEGRHFRRRYKPVLTVVALEDWDGTRNAFTFEPEVKSDEDGYVPQASFLARPLTRNTRGAEGAADPSMTGLGDITTTSDKTAIAYDDLSGTAGYDREPGIGVYNVNLPPIAEREESGIQTALQKEYEAHVLSLIHI